MAGFALQKAGKKVRKMPEISRFRAFSLVREAGVEQAGNVPFAPFQSPLRPLSAKFHAYNPLFYLPLPPHGSVIREKIRENIYLFFDNATQRVQTIINFMFDTNPITEN